jgi:hypothetical protein
MPTDVEVGSGYCGDALFNRFPGQYRDPEMNTQEKAHFASFPGNHGPVYTDPDVGRKMILKEVPGIGQVVVPVDHTMAQVVNVEHTMAGMGAVYPSDHTMVGLGDDPKTPHGKLVWHNTLVSALDQTAHFTNSSQQLATSFNDVAQKAIQRAAQKAKAGQFGSVEAAMQYVRDAITAAAGNFKPAVQKIAIHIGATSAMAAQPILKSVWRAPKPGAKGVGDWPGSMMGNMGGWATDVWNILTGKSQAWYSNLSNIQNQLNVLLGGITGIGKDGWNTYAAGSQGPTQDGSVLGSGVDDYDSVVNEIQNSMKQIIVTQDYVPSDAAIAQAQADQVKYQAQLDSVFQSNADLAAQATAGQQQVQAVLPAPMQSPSVVGQQAFTDTVIARAKGMVDTGTSTLTYVAIGAGIIGGVYVLSNLNSIAKTLGLA